MEHDPKARKLAWPKTACGNTREADHVTKPLA
jgi:hypothetical protein